MEMPSIFVVCVCGECLFQSFNVVAVKHVAAWLRGRVAANKISVNLPSWQRGRVAGNDFFKFFYRGQ